jgi:hypothetical protein
MSAKNRLLVGGRKRQPRREPRLLQLVQLGSVGLDYAHARLTRNECVDDIRRASDERGKASSSV